MKIAKAKPKRFKKAGDEPGAKYKESTIQVGIKKLFKSRFWYRRLLPIIRQEVLAVNQFMNEFSIYVSFKCHVYTFEKPEQETTEFFNRLDDNYLRKIAQELQNGGLHDYGNLRATFGGDLTAQWDLKGRCELVRNSIKQYATNFKTTIQSQTKSLLELHFKYFDDITAGVRSDAWVTDHVQDLMTSGEENEFEVDFQSNPYQLIPILLRIQKDIRNFQLDLGFDIPKGLKAYLIVPLTRYTNRHVLYSRASFLQIRNRELKTRKRELLKINDQDIDKSRDVLFEPIDFKQFETPKTISTLAELNRKFNLSFSTDGYSASIHYRRKVKEPTIPTKFDVKIGCDPGLKVTAAVAIVEENQPTIDRFVTSKDFLSETGHNARKRKLAGITEKFEDEQRLKRIRLCNPSTVDRDFRRFTGFCLSNMKERQSIYTQNNVSKLAWNKKMRTRAILDHFAEFAVPKNKTAAVFYGNGVLFRGARGYVHTPRLPLLEAFKRLQRTTVYITDEFRTSRLCNQCFGFLKTFPSPSRLQLCEWCDIVWDRDENAARNMVVQGSSQHFGLPLPENFERDRRQV